MRFEYWIKQNTETLIGKKIAITGSTGGLGRALCAYMAKLGAELILLDRNELRSYEHAVALTKSYGVSVQCMKLDLEDMCNVVEVTEKLKDMSINALIHNAGAYSIPRRKYTIGFDNVFQINFVSPYYMTRELLPCLNANDGNAVIVGSIAHNYSRIDKFDIDFSRRKAASKVYGNAKRWLMCSMYSLVKDCKYTNISVTHPGISFTGITDHYPKLVFAVIKHPMKIIFMKPNKACLSVLLGIFEKTDCLE